MTDYIPVRELTQVDKSAPLTQSSSARLTPAQLGGKIHTRSFSGYFRRLRIAIAGALAVLFFGTSWINWQGHQAVLWDLPERKFYVFGATYLPEDFLLLSFVMCISAFLLLAVSMLAGRSWCGYACPQSTWTWAFMWIEKITEGESYQRVKLDAAPWLVNKLLRRSSKHLLWALASLATGVAFMGYFMPIRELSWQLVTADLDIYYTFWVMFIAGMTYLNAGWLREKVCTHMCPYSRFQSAVFDKDTLIIGYDFQRGESRGSRRKEEDSASLGLGDCIDCHMCVQVCPTGIDIRDGLQMDCIGCAACVDACDSVMDRMGYARGLVSYTSERQLQTPIKQRTQKTVKIAWRNGLLAYVGTIGLLIAVLVVCLNNREQVELSVYRDRNVARINDAGDRVNVYLLKITNKTQQAQTYTLNLVSDQSLYLTKAYQLTLAGGERYELPVAVSLKHQAIMPSEGAEKSGHINFSFALSNIDQPEQDTQKIASFIY